MVEPAWRREHERLILWMQLEVPELTAKLRKAMVAGNLTEVELLLSTMEAQGLDGDNPYT